jgi:hypothetical protein
MAIRFKDTISINEEYTFPLEDGTVDQILATDGAGNISFVDVAGGEAVKIECKNTSGSTITKGTPVYVTGTVGTSFRVEVAPADASDSAKMPAVGLLETDLANNGEGYIITGGLLKNLTTDPIDGTNTTSNDTIYVKAGGGLTMTKPTGSDLIQNIGKVGRVNTANAGSIVVSSILRTNDVPNLTEGKIWVGSANNTIESTVVHIDETNTRVGIGTTSPASKMHVDFTADFDGLRIQNSNRGHNYLLTTAGTSAERFGIYDIDNSANLMQVGYDQVRIYTNNAERLRIDSSGQVGIGTDSPSSKLEVSGQMMITSNYTGGKQSDHYLYIGGDGIASANAAIYIGNKGDGSGYGWELFYEGTGSGNNNKFKLIAENLGSPVTVLTALQDGNLGIGTDSPSEKLDVEGNIGASNINLGRGASSNFGTGVPTLRLQGTSQNGRAGAIWFKNYDDNNVAALYVTDDTADDYGTTLCAYSGSIRFATQTLDAEKMIITSNGNVGIGTTSPANTTHIYKNATIGPITSTTTANAGLRIQDSGANMYLDGNSIVTDSTGFLTTVGNNYFAIGTNNTSRIYIAGGGNVGIGTESPDTKLHIEGNLLVDAYSIGEDNGIFLREGFLTIDQPSITVWDMTNSGVSPDGLSINANDGIRFRENGGEVARFKDGNFGIGTTSPATKLQVSGGVLLGSVYTQPSGSSWTTSNSQLILGGAHNLEFNDDNPGVKLLISGYNNDGTTLYPIWVEDENGLADFWLKNRPSQSGKPMAYFGGNIAINTTNPTSIAYSYAQDLVINGGSSSSDGVGISLVSNGKTFGVIAFGDAADTNAGEIYYSHSANDMVFRVNNGGTEFKIEPGYVQAQNQMRAPIFYDSNDTNYYMDPSSTSAAGLRAASGQLVSLYQASWTTGPSHFVLYNGWKGGTGDYLLVKGSGNQSGGNGAIIIGENGVYYGQHGNAQAAIDSSTAPLATNWGYLNSQGLHIGNTSNQYIGRDGNFTRIQTQYGYMDIGANNSSYAHFYTDRPSFYFGSAITIGGIIYDYQNTNYYLDPAGTSNIYSYNRGLAEVAGWVPAYSNSTASTVRWNTTEDATELQSDSDVSAGVAHRAIRVKKGCTYRWTITLKGNTASSSGLYIRNYLYTSNLPDGKTHVSNSASYTFVQEDSTGTIGWGVENAAVPSSWTTYEKEVTATADGYMSMVVLNWTGHGSNSIYLKTPDVQLVQVQQPTYYDSDNTNFYANFNAVGDSIRTAGDIVAYYSSDKRLKDNIIKIDAALDKVNAIGGYTFDWNEESHKATGSKDVGVIAQEVEEIFPEIVQTRSNGYKAVNYEKLVPLLIEAVKELSEKVKILENK